MILGLERSAKDAKLVSRTLELLKERMLLLGIEPKKSLGQNFLVSDHVVDKICRTVEELHPATLYEVGPGLGALTSILKEKFNHYHLIELDSQFAKFWRDQGMNVVEADALQIDWDGLPTEGEPRVLVSNLPYQISSSLVIDRTLDEKPLESMVLMFQKEVAQRIRAKPRTPEYGLLSVIAQVGWKIDMLLEASSRDFLPPPKVASRVLIFQRKPMPVRNPAKFLTFVKWAYAQRRKLLINNLMAGSRGDLDVFQRSLEKQGLAPKCRAEELSPQQMVDLYLELGYDRAP